MPRKDAPSATTRSRVRAALKPPPPRANDQRQARAEAARPDPVEDTLKAEHMLDSVLFRER